jgi:hypothetical protein
MQSLGKSMVARERDAIKIGIAQCSLAELMGDPLIGLSLWRATGRPPRPRASAVAGRAGAGAIARPKVLARRSPPIIKQSRIVYSVQAILSKVHAGCTLLRRRKR